MIEKIGISYKGYKGFVSYNLKKKIITVEFNHPIKKGVVERYLGTRQEFKIPESNKIDDYRIDVAFPKDEQTYFELAMNELYTKTGVFVDWETEKILVDEQDNP